MAQRFSKRILAIRSPSHLPRTYATQTGLGSVSQPRPRKAVTVTSDDGAVAWRDLRPGEKAARATQQTFNLGVILAGIAMTGGVAYYLYLEVFSSDSATRHFNRVVDEVRANPQARELLGPAKTIEAYGESTSNRLRKNRPIAHSTRKDGSGREHLLMHFNVKGSVGTGVVHVHMARKTKESHYEYEALSLDVPGHKTLHLRSNDRAASKNRSTGFKFMGTNWK